MFSLSSLHRAAAGGSPQGAGVNPIETEVRRLRDQVYGKPISDEAWLLIRHNWLQPSEIAWLREHASRITHRP